MLFVWLFKLTAVIPLALFFRPRIRGKKNVPKTPCILAVNHGAAMDPVLINVAFPFKRIYMLTTKKLFNCNRLHQWELKQMGCRPRLSPSGDMETLNEIVRNIKSYELISFFPEGMIKSSVGSFKSGAVMLALTSGLPIVPVYIRTAPFFRGGTAITFGKPMKIGINGLADAKEIEIINQKLRKKIIMLSDKKTGGCV
ncbi:MAG: 1-acyl-sn-glycerol-3-phosphate acyltransferase [Lachnospiraceae bacterium]|nr:1-acyl-sn-glycerol-3-phosphate acyltransferase [Lachnospiraceae bacterium]